VAVEGIVFSGRIVTFGCIEKLIDGHAHIVRHSLDDSTRPSELVVIGIYRVVESRVLPLMLQGNDTTWTKEKEDRGTGRNHIHADEGIDYSNTLTGTGKFVEPTID